MFGWAGTLRWVNLTKEEIIKEPLSPEFPRKFLGGLGFCNKITFDELNPKVKEDLFP